MAQMGRPGLSSQQKHELWARWKAGQSLSDIGRSFGKHARSIFGLSDKPLAIRNTRRCHRRCRQRAMRSYQTRLGSAAIAGTPSRRTLDLSWSQHRCGRQRRRTLQRDTCWTSCFAVAGERGIYTRVLNAQFGGKPIRAVSERYLRRPEAANKKFGPPLHSRKVSEVSGKGNVGVIARKSATRDLFAEAIPFLRQSIDGTQF